MLGALIIVFREVIEAGLIVGIILAVTKGLRGSRLFVGLGVAAGVAGACLVAAFAGALAEALAGVGQEVFNASILLLAVAMLTWHNVWMASHGRELAAEVKNVGAEVRSGQRSLAALGIVVAVAVMREGSEVALFLYGLAASSGASGFELLEGGALGLVLGVGVTALTYLGLVTIPTRWLFRVTTALITFLAAGLAAQAMLFLQQAGLVTALSRDRVGHLGLSLRHEPARPRAAYIGRLRRPAVRLAGGGLSYRAVWRLWPLQSFCARAAQAHGGGGIVTVRHASKQSRTPACGTASP